MRKSTCSAVRDGIHSQTVTCHLSFRLSVIHKAAAKLLLALPRMMQLGLGSDAPAELLSVTIYQVCGVRNLKFVDPVRDDPY